jgi:uncharacterized protein (TIGR00369 family)
MSGDLIDVLQIYQTHSWNEWIERDMTDEPKYLDFWEIVEGRAPAPASARLVGWRFLGLDESGALSCSFEATEALLNPVGQVQGGILAAMLDEAMSPVVAAITRERIFMQTLEMKVSFMRAARAGIILGEGRILHRGRSIAFLEGRLMNSGGELIAIASATSRIVPPSP